MREGERSGTVRQAVQWWRCQPGVGGDESEDEGDPRNQDDNRRVGAMMHDAQIRAIIPITVQIIVRELVAANASPPPKHNRAPCLTPNRNGHGSESISAGAARRGRAESKRISAAISG